MKKNIFNLSAIVLFATATVLTGCKKDDTTPPVVTLNGAASQTISLNTPYTELGATANDEKDGILTPVISGTVNKDLTGTYTITYTSTDAAGNAGTATRTVIVKNDAEIYAGTYTANNPGFPSSTACPTCPDWTQTITASTTTNNRIVFSRFGARTGNNTIEAALTGGTTFVIIDKTVSGLGASGCTFRYTPDGSGMAITQSGGKYHFSVKYYEERILGAGACTAVAATAFEDTFTQQ